MNNKKMIMRLLIVIVFVCILVLPKTVNAIASPIHLYYDEDTDEVLDEGHYTSDDGTVAYDEENGILTLDNYHGGEIGIYLDDDLTIILNGENVITSNEEMYGIITYYAGGIIITGDGSLEIKNASDGICVQSDKLQIDSGNITITDAVDNAINVNGDFVFNGGNIVINSTGENVLAGIISNFTVEINGGYISMNTEQVGIYSFGGTSFSGGKVVINSVNFGILSFVNLTIDDGYLEISTPSENTSIALVAVSDDVAALDISDDMLIEPDNFTKQKFLVAPDDDMEVVTFGNEGASLTLEYGLSDVVSSNVATSIKIYKTNIVSFNTNGGSLVNNMNVIYGATLGIPIEPTKDGYAFAGWYKDNNLENAFDFDTLITENTTLYAKWIKKYNITVTSNNENMGTVSANLTSAIKDTKITLTATPKTGYRFVKWESSDADVSDGTFDMLEKDVTINAIFEKDGTYNYEFINGNNQKLTIGDIDGYSFTIDGDFGLFESLSIGELSLIKDEDYKVTESSTIITFTNKGIAKLNGLKNDDYQIIVKYSNGKEVIGNVSLNVIENPNTSDDIPVYLILSIVSLLNLSISIYLNKNSHI